MISAVSLIVMCAFEGLATSTIMPNIVDDLNAESWFSVASGSAMAASLFAVVIAGALADWRGIRSVLVVGVVSFALGLALCAAAPAVWIFVLGRLIQGFGGGLIIVPLYMLIGSVASERNRPHYFAAFSLAWTMPAIVGPAIAGWAAETVGWRWVFGAVPAFSFIAFALFIPLLRTLPAERRTFPSKLRALGTMAFTASIGVLILQLAGAFENWQLFALSAIGFGMTAWYMPKLMPVGLFRFASGLPSLIGTRMFAMASMSASQAFIPLIMQRVHGWDAAWAATAVTLGSASWSIGSVFQARVKDPETRLRFPLIGAVLLFVGSVGTLVLLVPTIPFWVGLFLAFFLYAGVGLLHSTIAGLSLSMTPTKEHGKVSSWLQVADSAGAALQLAVTSVVLAAWGYVPGMAGTPAFYLPAIVLAIFTSVIAVLSAKGAQGARDAQGARASHGNQPA